MARFNSAEARQVVWDTLYTAEIKPNLLVCYSANVHRKLTLVIVTFIKCQPIFFYWIERAERWSYRHKLVFIYTLLKVRVLLLTHSKTAGLLYMLPSSSYEGPLKQSERSLRFGSDITMRTVEITTTNWRW